MADESESITSVLDRISELAKLLSYHSDLYYNRASPEISDNDYDKLWDELKKLDPNHPQLRRVGSDPPPGTTKAEHLFPMQSLDKANQAQQSKQAKQSKESKQAQHAKEAKGGKFKTLSEHHADRASELAWLLRAKPNAAPERSCTYFAGEGRPLHNVVKRVGTPRQEWADKAHTRP